MADSRHCQVIRTPSSSQPHGLNHLHRVHARAAALGSYVNAAWKGFPRCVNLTAETGHGFWAQVPACLRDPSLLPRSSRKVPPVVSRPTKTPTSSLRCHCLAPGMAPPSVRRNDRTLVLMSPLPPRFAESQCDFKSVLAKPKLGFASTSHCPRWNTRVSASELSTLSTRMTLPLRRKVARLLPGRHRTVYTVLHLQRVHPHVEPRKVLPATHRWRHIQRAVRFK